MHKSYASAVSANCTSPPLMATISTTSTPAISTTTDINHPYYLSATDHLGLALVNEFVGG